MVFTFLSLQLHVSHLRLRRQVQNSICGENVLLSYDGAEGQEMNIALFSVLEYECCSYWKPEEYITVQCTSSVTVKNCIMGQGGELVG